MFSDIVCNNFVSATLILTVSYLQLQLQFIFVGLDILSDAPTPSRIRLNSKFYGSILNALETVRQRFRGRGFDLTMRTLF
jgi:hypothetical protein